MPEPRAAQLFVIAAPSGAGKTTLVKALVARLPSLRFSISYTTRTQRRNEVDGRDYLFVDVERFAQLRKSGELLESAQVFDHCYGTSRSQVEAHLRDGHDVVLEIDWQGARQVRESMPDSTSIFILPPSLDELERRLRDRRTDDVRVIEKRLRSAIGDMSHWEEFDHVIINDDLDEAVATLCDVFGRRPTATTTRDRQVQRRVRRLLAQ